MVIGFRHRGLRPHYEKGDRRRVPSEYVDKLERILARLDEAIEPASMGLPGFRLHRLRGDLAGYWSVGVSANWRIVFRFDGVHASDVDLIDYH